MLTFIGYIFVVLALYGAFLNSNMRTYASYKIWAVSNTALFAYNVAIKCWPQAILFLFYMFTSFNGLKKCRLEELERRYY